MLIVFSGPQALAKRLLPVAWLQMQVLSICVSMGLSRQSEMLIS